MVYEITLIILQYKPLFYCNIRFHVFTFKKFTSNIFTSTTLLSMNLLRAHTQNIERTWLEVRHKFKRMQGAPQELFDSYLSEYMWRRNVVGIYSNRRVFFAILGEIKNQYSL